MYLGVILFVFLFMSMFWMFGVKLALFANSTFTKVNIRFAPRHRFAQVDKLYLRILQSTPASVEDAYLL